MKKWPVLTLAFLFLAGTFGVAWATSRAGDDPTPPIATGYGSWGAYQNAIITDDETATLTINGDTRDHHLYAWFPDDSNEAFPAILFAPGWNAACSQYDELLRFVASKGYVAVCDEFNPSVDSHLGDHFYAGFKEAAAHWSNRLETAYFGLIGHSSGAGILPSTAYRLAADGWGAEGKFIFSAAPWVDFNITPEMLTDYPADLKLIVETYACDTLNGTDVRIFIDQFEMLTRIPDSEKDYLILRPDTIGDYHYDADHDVIAMVSGGMIANGKYDAMDDYGVFRLLDALADYTFHGNAAGKAVALGNGNAEQITMHIRDLVSTDNPRPDAPPDDYQYRCDADYNPRRDHCYDYDDELPPPVLRAPIKQDDLDCGSGKTTFTWEPVRDDQKQWADHYTLEVWQNDALIASTTLTAAAAGCAHPTKDCTDDSPQPVCQSTLTLPCSASAHEDLRWRVQAANTAVERTGVWSRWGVYTCQQADLLLAMSATPEPVPAGSILTYTLRAANAGPGSARAVTIHDPLPPYTAFYSSTCSGTFTGGIWQSAPRRLTGGQTLTCRLAVRVLSNAPLGSTLTATAYLESCTTDPTPEDNSSVVATLIDPKPRRCLTCEEDTLKNPHLFQAGSHLARPRR